VWLALSRVWLVEREVGVAMERLKYFGDKNAGVAATSQARSLLRAKNLWHAHPGIAGSSPFATLTVE
jgi:hypothetical protein